LYKEKLKNHLASGVDYPTARSLALQDLTSGDLSNYLNKSNSILGVEYCKSLIKLKSSISPFAVKREGSYTETSLSNNFSSASSIRKYLKSGNDVEILKTHVPNNIFNELNHLKNQGYNFIDYNHMMPFIKYKYYTNKDSIMNLPDVSEGIENRIFDAIEQANSFEELISLVKTKRYTYSRISRIITQFFIGFDYFDTRTLRKVEAPYARILGLNEKGAQILKRAKQLSSIPLITKIKTHEFEVMDLEIQATNAYSLLNRNVKFNQDFYNSPVIIKE